MDNQESYNEPLDEGKVKVFIDRILRKMVDKGLGNAYNPKMREEIREKIEDIVRETMEKYDYLVESTVNEKADYKYKKSSQYPVKATVCYLDPMRRKRICKDIFFKSKFDALGFKDNVKGFPKGAEVEAINEEDSSRIKSFNQYIEEMSTPANTPGMGSVVFPGDPGLSGNFSSQAHGSGDMPIEIYKKKKKKKSKK